MKYKYLFRVGKGKRVVDLLGPSIDYFWNDIYDGFDLFKELTVRKLDRTEFTESEIRKIAGELFEDMDEDGYLIGTEIGAKKLYFFSLGNYWPYDLDEYQQFVADYYRPSGKPKTIDILPKARELFFRRIDDTLVGVLVIELLKEGERISESLVEKFRKDCDENKVDVRLIVTNNETENGVKEHADSMDIQIKSTGEMGREMNENHLESALREHKAETLAEKEPPFSSDRFKVLLDYVKNARTNVDKKNSLEDLAEYLMNGIEGLRVMTRNPRGPSEEVDLIVANESKNEFFRKLGKILLVECRHRRKPATSKDIRDFSGKMGSMAIKTAFLFSLKGITGEKYNALSALRDARKDGKDIIVLDTNDFLQISEGTSPIIVIRNAFYRLV